VKNLPIYTGVDGEESQGLCIGTENFFCVNSQASAGEQKAAKDFIYWLYSSETGKDYVTNKLGFIAPFDTFEDLLDLIKYFREHDCHDDVVIYTGYYENEIQDRLDILKHYDNIIVKFGRFKPNQESHFDEVLGINLANIEQYATKIS
jgi:ABC-type glycerol-3-phosphate transport system substrate-binding protein